MSIEVNITPMRRTDLPEVMGLERDTFSSPWTERMFRDEMALPYSHIFLARDEGGSLIGFICFWVLLGEMHILNLAVRKDMRRRGIGTRLATEALRYAAEHGARSSTLEVRERNGAAIALYSKLGFAKAGLRRGYYESPPDNAVIMWSYDISRFREKSP